MRYPLPVLVLGSMFLLTACGDGNAPQQPAGNKATNTSQTTTDQQTRCYSLQQGQDLTVVQLQQEGNTVSGYYAWEPYEKDGAHGTLNGEMADDLIKTIHTYMIEGSIQSEEAYFKLEGDKLLQGDGELADDGGIMTFKDPANLKFTDALSAVDCASVQDTLDRTEQIAASIEEQQASNEGGLDLGLLDENLGGEWQSTQDPKAHIVLEEGKYTNRYDGKVVDANPYQLLDACPESCGKALPDTPCLQVKGQDEVCYAILIADGEKLELSQVNGTGNSNPYQRFDSGSPAQAPQPQQ